MTHTPLVWIGLGGVAPDDNALAHHSQHRLHWVMLSVALLSIPAYALPGADIDPVWHRVAVALDVVIFGAFAAELAWMMRVSSFPWRYLFENWLNVVIIIGAAAAVLGAATDWIAVVRVMRAAVAVLILVRAASEFHKLFTQRGAAKLFGVSCLAMLVFGALFYWLDPAVKSYSDGLWLAFITGATVGYGDLVPTTAVTRLIAVLTVLIGIAMMALFTASVVASFIGAEETRTRENLQRDIVALRGEIAALLNAEELRITRELHREIRELRQEISQLRAESRALKPPAAGGNRS